MLILFFSFIALILYRISNSTEKVGTSLSNWRVYSEELGVPAQEFFDRIQKSVEDLEISDIEISKVTHRQEGIFSERREYLRIARSEYVIDICAAPFGKGYFISYWLGKTDGGLLAKIPIVNTLLGKDLNSKTYYQADTEQMFKERIHECIKEVIGEFANNKGVREKAELNVS